MRRQISAPRPTTLSLYHFQKEANTWFTGRRDLRVRVDVITCIAVKYNPVNICIVRMSITIGLPLRNHRSWGLVHARLRAINEHRPLKRARGSMIQRRISIFAMREQGPSIEMENDVGL